jgi:hypothetical protein
MCVGLAKEDIAIWIARDAAGCQIATLHGLWTVPRWQARTAAHTGAGE